MKDKIIPLTQRVKESGVLAGNDAYRRDLESQIPNHLSKPLAWYDSILDPLYQLWAGIKRLILGLWTFFKVAVFTLGLVALYYIVNYHRGWIDVTILSEGDLKHMSGDLLKPKVEGKKVK